MKKLAIIGGIFLLTAVFAYPAFAGGQGWRGGCTGYGQGRGPEYCPRNTDGGPGNLSSEQRTKLEKLHYGFLGDTADLRNKIWSKKSEMENLLNGANLDETKIRELQKEISALKTEMGEKRINYELEAKKIAPEAGSYKESGRGYGRGYRGNCPNQGGAGRGFGPGSCCN